MMWLFKKGLVLGAINLFFAFTSWSLELRGWAELTAFFESAAVSTEGRLAILAPVLPGWELQGRVSFQTTKPMELSLHSLFYLSPFRFSMSTEFREGFRRMALDASYWKTPWRGKLKFSLPAADTPSLELSWAYEAEYSCWAEGVYELTGRWQDWKQGWEGSVFPGWRWRIAADFDENLTIVTFKQRWKGDTAFGHVWLYLENLNLTEVSWSWEQEELEYLFIVDVAVVLEDPPMLEASFVREMDLGGTGLELRTPLHTPRELKQCLLSLWGEDWKVSVDVVTQALRLRVTQRWSAELKVHCDLTWEEEIEGEAWISVTFTPVVFTLGMLKEEGRLRLYASVYWEW